MSATILKYSLVAAVVLVAAVGGAWYLLAPGDIVPDATPTPIGVTPGTIEGSTLYPSEFNPAQRVCAQSVTDPAYERCTDVPEQDGPDAPTFSIKVAPGSYHVYATLQNPGDLGLQEEVRAYWTEFVTCGLHADCPSHARLEVKVQSGRTVTGILPHDWYDTR
jgi:hypothetical protein